MQALHECGLSPTAGGILGTEDTECKTEKDREIHQCQEAGVLLYAGSSLAFGKLADARLQITAAGTLHPRLLHTERTWKYALSAKY